MRVAVEIILSDDEVLDLSKLSKSRSVSVRLAERSRIVLLAGKGMTNEEIGNELGITRQKAGRWREALCREVASKALARMRIVQGENRKSLHARLPR